MEEEENLCRFGTPLDPLDEDEIPSKKPIAIEDQIVTDSNGKRRFHGAFTGGFSAGFWNTVGSLEGWKPQSFKSSRTEKADTKQQKPIDFMDDEDLGEFGIAPQRIQTTEDFTSQDANSKSANRKRKLQNLTTSSCPIPGVPVLHQLLQPAKENVAIRLLKRMGWKPGQGIGARQTRKEKKAATERNARERYVMKKYGCDLGPVQIEHPSVKDDSDGDEDDDSDYLDEEITFAPDDFEPLICGIKDNTFGLGYTGLSRNPVLKKQQQHIDLFGPFEIMSKDNKKLSIRGQAFGVGALEEEDEDIYARDDMTKYDFSLEEIKKSAPKKKIQEDLTTIEGFHVAKNNCIQKKVFTVTIPVNFKPRNWAVRKSRFEPLDEKKAALLKTQNEHKIKGLGRHDLDPEERGRILEESKMPEQEANAGSTIEKEKRKTYLEKINDKYKKLEKKGTELMNLLESKKNNFSTGEVINAEKKNDAVIENLDENVCKENEKIQEEAKKITKSVEENKTGVFKPFINNEAKQERYEKFIEANLNDDEEITKFLASIQPLNMSEWDREMEKKEFLQAKKIYKPLKGLMSDRFISESTALTEKLEIKKLSESKKKIEIKRIKVMWKPCSQLCKRFNIPEPFGGTMVEEKQPKKPRFSIFDYLEGSVNKKENFITPVIIPTTAEKPKPIIQQSNEKLENSNSTSSRLSTKELFAKEMEDKCKETPTTTVKETTTAIAAKSEENENKSTKSKEPLKKSTKHKTDLEIKVEETKDKHPSEKKDLFKAIFESSSEDEAEDEEEKSEKTEQSEISTNIIHSLTKPAAELNVLRNTSPPRGIFAYLFKEKANELKNPSKDEESNSMTKVKELIETDSNKPENISKNFQSPRVENQMKLADKEKEEKEEKEKAEEANTYGPKIPTKIIPSISSDNTTNLGNISSDSVNDEIDQKLLKMLKKKSKKNTEIIEEWVEKTETIGDKKKKKKEKDKKKKTKKHKKEKKKHKDKK